MGWDGGGRTVIEAFVVIGLICLIAVAAGACL
jgi:hypothetical protein